MITDTEIQKAIRAAQPHGRPTILRDPGERGAGRLSLVVRRGKNQASAEWYANWYRNGDRRTTQIGRYPALTLKAARALYREKYLPAIMSGQDPIGPRATQRAYGQTVEDLFEAYSDHLLAKKKRSAQDVRRMLLGPKGAVHDIGRRRLARDVETKHLTPHLAAIRARGAAGQAHLVRSYLKAAFEFGITAPNAYDGLAVGVDWGLTSNPASRIKVDRDALNTRDRALTREEFAHAFWWFSDRSVRDRAALAVQLMMLTGQRPGEIMKIRLGSIGPDGQHTWKKTKNGFPHSIPLVGLAKAAVDSSEPNEHGLFFWSPSRPGAPAEVSAARRVLHQYIRETGVPSFTLHDLRRTWKTLAGDAGVAKELRDLIQNHRKSDVSSRHYDRYDYAREKRAGLSRWDAYVVNLLSQQPFAPVGAYYRFAGFTFDAGNADLRSPEGRVRLTPSEAAVMKVLLDNAGQVLSRADLIRLCFDDGTAPTRCAVDLRISRLRARLGGHGFDIIKTCRRGGFMLAGEVAVELPRSAAAPEVVPRTSAAADSEAVTLLRQLALASGKAAPRDQAGAEPEADALPALAPWEGDD